LLRRYYLKNGYVDFHVLSTDAQLSEDRKGYIIKITIEEGPQYKIGTVNVESHINDVSSSGLLSLAKTSPGDVYSVDAVDKTLVAMTTSVASRGYAFAQVRPRGDRVSDTNTVNLVYVVEEGPRVYIERINVRGNVRTKDEVVRREFDLGEGDAYNKVMVDRAERRLKNLGFFKTVHITNEPGTTPDRVVINVDVEDQPTGQFSVSAGYSTSDGVIGEVAVSESNLLGRGQFARISGSLGQYANGVEFNFTEPYFMDHRLAAGFDLFTKYTDNSRYTYYNMRNTGGALRLGFALTEDVMAQIRYTIYQSEIKIPNDANHPYGDCTAPNNPVNSGLYSVPDCVANGEASVAIKEAAGRSIVSMPGYTLSYNTLDNNKNPRSGLYAEIRQDFAGAGGDSKFIRSSSEVRMYREITDDFVGVVKGMTGYVYGNNLRMIDNFNLGPALVRGFAPGGIGPRDITVDPRMNALGGTTYFGGSTEVQFPVFGMPKEVGMKIAVFADAGTLFGYQGKKDFSYLCADNSCYNYTPSYTQLNVHDSHMIRSSVGTSLIWSSPLGPIRFDFAKAITKDTYDRTQFFRFSGGTSF
jgi:outer membrane protein insertion porin family